MTFEETVAAIAALPKAQQHVLGVVCCNGTPKHSKATESLVAKGLLEYREGTGFRPAPMVHMAWCQRCDQ